MAFNELNDKQKQKIYALNPNVDKEMFDKAMEGIVNIIKVCNDNPDRDGLQETPFRVVKAFVEHTQGYLENPNQHLHKEFDVGGHSEMIIIKDIDFNSMCEHHFAPFHGKVHIGYIPKDKITGLSKFGRLVDGYAKRFQVQERLTSQIANAINDELDPLGVMVVIEAVHTCMCSRGVKKQNASTTTSAVRGLFHDEAQARNEFLSLIK